MQWEQENEEITLSVSRETDFGWWEENLCKENHSYHVTETWGLNFHQQLLMVHCISGSVVLQSITYCCVFFPKRGKESNLRTCAVGLKNTEHVSASDVFLFSRKDCLVEETSYSVLAGFFEPFSSYCAIFEPQ